MMQTQLANSGARSSLLECAGNIDLSSIQSPPQGLELENLRRRGIDIVRIRWAANTKNSWWRLWRKASAMDAASVAFVDRQIHIQDSDARGVKSDIKIALDELTDVGLASDQQGAAQVVLKHRSGSVAIGNTLSSECQIWLRDRIILEAAGLTWKPLYNVGKRSTRQTSKPEDDLYRQWASSRSRLIDLYLSQAVDKFEGLSAALSSGDFEKARHGAHWMKSSSAAVGAHQLSELCQRLEIDLDAKDAVRVAALAPHLTSEFETVRAALLASRACGSDSNSGSEDEGDLAAAAASDGLLAGFSVLLVEDSRVNQEIASDCLLRAGASVETADDGQSAIEKHEGGSFDLILMDCQMSGVDGFAATRAIRDSDRRVGRRPIPIIALTANALRDDRTLCLAAGMNDYLSKPFVETDLIQAVAKWVALSDEQRRREEDGASKGPEAALFPNVSASLFLFYSIIFKAEGQWLAELGCELF